MGYDRRRRAAAQSSSIRWACRRRNWSKINRRLQDKYRRIEAAEIRFEEEGTAEADLVVVAYGTTSRVAKSAVDMIRAEGGRVGLFRPITLWPFPADALATLAQAGKRFLVAEMSAGQLVEDVRLAVSGRAPVELFAVLNGNIPTARQIYQAIRAYPDVAKWRCGMNKIFGRPASLDGE